MGWPNFSPAEIACRGTGNLLVSETALDKLQALRDRLGKPLIVRSAYRSPKHNRAVGGAKRSKHMEGAAFDIAMTNHDPVAFEAAVRPIAIGETFRIRAGCAWRLKMCRAKFANVASFRGFPNTPSQHALIRCSSRDGGHKEGSFDSDRSAGGGRLLPPPSRNIIP